MDRLMDPESSANDWKFHLVIASVLPQVREAEELWRRRESGRRSTWESTTMRDFPAPGFSSGTCDANEHDFADRSLLLRFLLKQISIKERKRACYMRMNLYSLVDVEIGH
jgi:hypothetical protein